MTWEQLIVSREAESDDGVAIFRDKKEAKRFYAEALRLWFPVLATEVPSNDGTIYYIYNEDVPSQKSRKDHNDGT